MTDFKMLLGLLDRDLHMAAKAMSCDLVHCRS
jgi:hypothetical protein